MSAVELTVTDHFTRPKTIISRLYTVSSQDLPAFIEALQSLMVKYPKQVRMGTTTDGPTTVIDIEIGALTARPPVRSGQTFEQLYRREQEVFS